MTDSQRFAEVAGDIQCPVCGYYCLGKGGFGCIDKPKLVELEDKRNDETDPLALLRVMRQRNDFYHFVQWCGSYSEDGVSYDVVYDIADFIQKFLDTPGALLEAVDEWIRRGK